MKTVYIVLTFCAGLFLGYLIFPSHTDVNTPASNHIAITEGKLDSIDARKQEAIVQFQLKNNQLAKSLISTSALLADNKELLIAERRKVMTLTKQLRAGADSLLADSLWNQSVLLNSATDSIICNYETRDSVMQQMVALRDTQLILCDQSYQDVKGLIREQEQRELQLTTDLNTALKENRKVRLKNKFLAAGILFVSGLATTIYIKSK